MVHIRYQLIKKKIQKRVTLTLIEIIKHMIVFVYG